MVFYRKYRPQTIEELDLESVRDRLQAILKSKEIPHAFLFTGPKGLGKTSTARILAKAINCEKNSESKKIIEPCNKCDACISITNGSNLDVLEIDAASNRGIDEIRDLREKIKFAPASLPKKVYIIDEVHMLTTDAFNALLKTLEEPPSHAIFILCTTEEEKIPPTISSRTFHVVFKKPSKEEVIRSVSRIIKGEGLDIAPKVLDEVYRLAGGSFRDAAKVVEELSINESGKITEKTVERAYKTGSTNDEVMNLLEALSRKDARVAIGVIEELSKTGADFKVVTEKIAEIIHGIILKRAGVEIEILDIESFTSGDLKKLLEVINQSYKDIKFSILPQIPLELVAVGWCLDQNQISNIKDKKEEKREEVPVQIKANEEKIQEEKKEKEHGELFRENALPKDFFAELINRVKKDNHSIAGILRGCKLVELTDNTARFETKYKFHRDKLNESKTKSILDKRSSELLSRNIQVVVEMKEK